MNDALIPICLFLGAFAMVFGIRYLSNKEKMALIERGMNPGISASSPKPYLSLKFGLLLVGLGLGLMIALLTVTGLNIDRQNAVAVYFGCLALFGGLGLIGSFLIEKKTLDK